MFMLTDDRSCGRTHARHRGSSIGTVLFACVHLFSFSMISIASSVFGFAVGSPAPVLQYAPVRSPAVVCRMPWEPVESEPKEEEAPKEVRTQATKICISTVATLAYSHRP